MEQTAQPPPLAPAAFVYAAICVVVLALLPHLKGPIAAFHVPNAGDVFLGRDPVQGLLWGLLSGALLTGCSQALSLRTEWGKRFTRLLARTVTPLHPGDAVLLAGLSSLAEELVFRGLALPYLGLAASSILFGLAHLIPRDGLWPWSLWAAATGGVLGWLALATGGLVAPMTAHFVINAVGLLLLAALPSENPE